MVRPKSGFKNMEFYWYSRLRNKIESSDLWAWVVYALTQNRLFGTLSYFVARKRIGRLAGKKTFGLAIENSSFCNARCIFCPNTHMKRKKAFMEMAVFNKLVGRLKEEKVVVSYVNLTGTGEPLMDKNIFNKIKILKKEFPKATLFLPTNFSLATRGVIEKLVDSGLDTVTISLNADNAVDYKRIMNLDFEKTIANIENLIEIKRERKSKLAIMLTIVVNDVNANNVDGFTKKWRDKVDAIAINGVHSWGGAVKKYNSNRLWKFRYPCRSLFEQIVIHTNGDVALCCVDYEGKVVGGNVIKDKIMDAFSLGKIGRIKKRHFNGEINEIKMCRQCRFSERGMDWLVK